jgi:hypothetical protein
MSTFKDITYKKNDDETWTEWTKRVPDNDEDKLDYIGETIYVKIYENDEEKAGKITGMLLEIGVEELIVLLESDELLKEKIEEAYQVLREDEEIQMSDEEVLSSEVEYLSAEEKVRVSNEALRVANEALRVANEACRVLKEEVYKEEKSKEDEEIKMSEEDISVLNNAYGEGGWGIKEAEEYKRAEKEDIFRKTFNTDPYHNRNDTYKVATITVAEMIEALSKLPPDAKLAMTESGWWSRREFARVFLPEPYIVGTLPQHPTDLPDGTQVYCIGHSHHFY